MYSGNPYYEEAINDDNKRFQARIKLRDNTLYNSNIKSIKYDLDINPNEKFQIGGVYGASISLDLLNYEGDLNNINFDNEEFIIDLKILIDDLYTVSKFDSELVKIINTLPIKKITSLWVPQGKFYATEIKKNENMTISIKLIDKTKYLEDEYVCTLTPPFTLKRLYEDVHSKAQVVSDTKSFYNENKLVNEVPVGYTHKQILGYIAECACGAYIVNRFGNGEIRSYGSEVVKDIEKGKYKEFLPSENYITIKKVKYYNGTIGTEKGHILELDDKNPFINDEIAQSIYNKMLNFTYIKYTLTLSNCDFAMDCADKISITNTKDTEFKTYIMKNSWEFTGAMSQNWEAKGENELSNTYSSSKGPINQELDRIVKEEIPTAKEEAIQAATDLITAYNGGYVIKKNGELYIADNEDLDKAQHVWRWNINGLGYSSTGVDGPYGLAITMDGKIVADFIATGTMSAERIKRRNS